MGGVYCVGGILIERNQNHSLDPKSILMTWNVFIVISWDIININARNTEPS